MPGRRRPRAALLVQLLGASAFLAAAVILRTSILPPSWTTPPLRAAAVSQPAPTTCAVVQSDRWSPLPGVEYTGRLQLDVPPAPGARMVLLVADALALDLEAQNAQGEPIPLELERLRTGPGIGIPPDLWLERGSPWDLPGTIVRATLTASPMSSQSVIVNLGRRAPQVLARLAGYRDDVRAEVCASRAQAAEAFADSDRFEIAPSSSDYFATGWLGEQGGTDGADRIRRMTRQGVILVPSARDGVVLVHLDVAPAVPAADVTLALRVNDVYQTDARPMRDGFASYEWRLPESAWLAHTNELLLTVSSPVTANRAGRDRRAPGLELRRLALTLAPE